MSSSLELNCTGTLVMYSMLFGEGMYVMNERLTQRTSSRDMGQDRVVRYNVS